MAHETHPLLQRIHVSRNDLHLNLATLQLMAPPLIIRNRLEEIDGWSQSEHQYDVICALNLLDRCSHPQTLLEHIHRALKPDGLVLVALVWPFQPYVETTTDHRPEEMLAIDATSIQSQASSFITAVLQPMGFQVISWSKVPYLCQGDLQRTFYHLSDLLFALKLQT